MAVHADGSDYDPDNCPICDRINNKVEQIGKDLIPMLEKHLEPTAESHLLILAALYWLIGSHLDMIGEINSQGLPPLGQLFRESAMSGYGMAIRQVSGITHDKIRDSN